MTGPHEAQLQRLSHLLAEEAAAQVPPFGAESVELARRLKTAATGLLLDRMAAGGWTALLALEALRAADPERYRSLPAAGRAQVYAAALGESLFFNAWGLPGRQLTETARAFAALGPEAVAALRPLLSDRRPAPLEGSQDATTSRIYGNRICDYAWVLIQEAEAGSSTYPRNPAERDDAIGRWLGAGP